MLLIDEAQTLKGPLLELLRQLMNYESNDQKFLQVVLFAQEEFRARLQHSRFRNLVNRAVMSSSLDTLSPSETHAMLRHRWVVAGGKADTFPFTVAHWSEKPEKLRDAMTSIQSVSGQLISRIEEQLYPDTPPTTQVLHDEARG